MSLTLNDRTKQFSLIIKDTVITDHVQEMYDLQNGIEAIKNLLKNSTKNHGLTYVIGNGGSAAIAGHAAIDLLNMANIRAMTLHEAATITCLSNDYGYEHVYNHQLRKLVRVNDLLIAISSSGQSKNILNAVAGAKENGAKVITLSGFSEENPLRQSGDINVWLNSTDYGFVEIGHAFVLHNITDGLKFKEEAR